MITLSFIGCRVHLIIDESLPLKEVLPPLLLLYQLLRLAIALLQLRLQPLFEFLDQTHDLRVYVMMIGALTCCLLICLGLK